MHTPENQEPNIIEKQEEFVDFSELCLEKIGMQTQYAKRYALGLHGYKNLGEGLRFRIERIGSEVEITGINKDDADEFVRRVRELKGR